MEGPYCQVSTTDSCLPAGGLRLPPAYAEPPAYESLDRAGHQTAVKAEGPDVVHYIKPQDSVSSLAVQYGMPAQDLRQRNQLHTDAQLWAHKMVMIPRKYCPDGVSRSANPIDSPEDEARKLRIRRFMLTCHVAE